jgi:hypothetical protein
MDTPATSVFGDRENPFDRDLRKSKIGTMKIGNRKGNLNLFRICSLDLGTQDLLLRRMVDAPTTSQGEP